MGAKMPRETNYQTSAHAPQAKCSGFTFSSDIAEHALIESLGNPDPEIRARAADELSRRILPPAVELDVEPLMQRIALDDREAALGLLALIHHQPNFAWAMCYYIAKTLDAYDELLLRLGDQAVRSIQDPGGAS